MIRSLSYLWAAWHGRNPLIAAVLLTACGCTVLRVVVPKDAIHIDATGIEAAIAQARKSAAATASGPAEAEYTRLTLCELGAMLESLYLRIAEVVRLNRVNTKSQVEVVERRANDAAAAAIDASIAATNASASAAAARAVVDAAAARIEAARLAAVDAAAKAAAPPTPWNLFFAALGTAFGAAIVKRAYSVLVDRRAARGER